jgi:hypothetical protein
MLPYLVLYCNHSGTASSQFFCDYGVLLWRGLHPIRMCTCAWGRFWECNENLYEKACPKVCPKTKPAYGDSRCDIYCHFKCLYNQGVCALSCGISDSFQLLWTEWIEATLHGTLFIRHDVDWKYSLVTEVMRRACCFDLSLAQALASCSPWRCVCHWLQLH